MKTQPKRYEFKMEKDDIRNKASYFSSFKPAHCEKYPVGCTVKKRQKFNVIVTIFQVLRRI